MAKYIHHLIPADVGIALFRIEFNLNWTLSLLTIMGAL